MDSLGLITIFAFKMFNVATFNVMIPMMDEMDQDDRCLIVMQEACIARMKNCNVVSSISDIRNIV